MKEQLIECLTDILSAPIKVRYDEPKEIGIATTIADHLIANGVTIQRWIPVTERLPTWADGNKYGGILAVRRGHELSDFYHCNDVKENPDEFTHWMPLPTPPKDGDT